MKLKIGIGLTVFIVIIFMAIQLFIPPKWVGVTSDGNITATLFETQEGSALVYNGELTWSGDKDLEGKLSNISTTYYENDVPDATGVQDNLIDYSFVIATREPEEDEKIEVQIDYILDNEAYSERVQLIKK